MVKPFAMKTKIYLCVVAILMSACASVEKMIETGHFDEAVYKAAQKIVKNDRKQQKYLPLFIEAYQIAMDRDMEKIKHLSYSNTSGDWYKISQLYHKISSRQDLIVLFRPLFKSNLVIDQFSLIPADSFQRSAENKYVDLLYEESLQLLAKARNGYKQAARDAYYRLNKVLEFRNDYLNIEALKDEAENIGVAHVALTFENNSGTHLHPALEEELLQNIIPLQKWTKYHVSPSFLMEPDYNTRISLDHIDIGPEKITEETFMEYKKIEDGFQYVLDKKGNVKKDSLGNDIKEPRFRKIKARVYKTHQFKGAYAEGRIIIEEAGNNKISDIPIYGDIVFEHHGGHFSGNRKALSKATKNWVFNAPVPFPSDESMLADVLHEFKRQIKSKMSNLRWPV
jgi:hypothetical protein